jgi:hypothetical protein
MGNIIIVQTMIFAFFSKSSSADYWRYGTYFKDIPGQGFYFAIQSYMYRKSRV